MQAISDFRTCFFPASRPEPFGEPVNNCRFAPTHSPTAMSTGAAIAAAVDGADQTDHSSGLQTVFDPETCIRKGLCPVSKLRDTETLLGSHSLYFEIHGTGKEKVVLILG